MNGNDLGAFMDRENSRNGCLAGCAVIGILVVTLLAWIVGSHFEAEAYFNATGRRVSTWDAMWIELRVSSEPK